MGRSLGLFLGLMLPLLPASFAGVEIGEFELPEVIPLSRDALREPRELVKSDPGLMRAVRRLSESEAKRFPTWQTLLNAAVRRAD